MSPTPPVLGFAAYSGVGKTTLLSRLIPLLKQRGYRVGIIKYSHHDVQIDQPGKDSFRLRAAGATPVMLVSPYRRAIISEFPASAPLELAAQLAAFPADAVDLILVEGFRDAEFPKIELHRPVLGKPLLCTTDPHVVALAVDQPPTPMPDLPCLDINDPAAVAEFIIARFLR